MENVEEWRIIPKFCGEYEVSSLGRIRKTDTKKLRKTPTGKIGYPVFSAPGRLFEPQKDRKKMYPVYVHICVALAFIPNPNGLPCINHKDGNKANNRVDNLEWCSHAENMKHASRTGLCKGYGYKPVLQIKEGVIVNEFFSAAEAERVTGIHSSAICNVANHRIKKDGAHYYTAGGYKWEWKS